nr:hypothetical protein [Tanacetum cinerariifolium]
MLHIFPRLPHQSFVEPPFEEEILAFLWFLGHSGVIRKLTDGLYHKRNVDFAYLMWEDFIYQVEHKDTKKRNEMYYPQFTKTMDTTTDQQVAMDEALVPHAKRLRIERSNFHLLSDIKSKESILQLVYDVMRVTPPKPKASVWKTRSSSETTITPPTAAVGPRLTTSDKGKQAAKASKAKSLSALFEVAMAATQQLKLATKRSLQQTHISQASGSGIDEGTGSIP